MSIRLGSSEVLDICPDAVVSFLRGNFCAVGTKFVGFVNEGAVVGCKVEFE